MLRGGLRAACAALMVGLFALGSAAVASANVFTWPADTPFLKAGQRPPDLDEAAEERLLELDKEFIANRTAGDERLDVWHAGALRSQAAHDRRGMSHTRPQSGPATFNGAWTSVGQTPMGE